MQLHARKISYLVATIGLVSAWIIGPAKAQTAIEETSETLAIHADVGDTVGDAAAISDFMCTEGGPAGDPASAEWEAEAWRNLRYMEGKYMALFSPGNTLEDSGGAGIVVVRDPARSENGARYFGPGKDLRLDFTAFDGMDELVSTALGYRTRIFEIAMMPNTLSFCRDTEISPACAPKNAAEFEEAVYHAVMKLNALGVKKPIIPLFGEPEAWDNFKGKNRSLEKDPTDQARLDDYVEMYIAAHKGATRANPRAIILGPVSGVYSSALAIEISGGVHHWGFDDFVRKLRAYNASHPMTPVIPNAIGWQGYDWDNSRRLSSGVHHIRKVMQENGFNPDTPQIIMGWNAEWTSDRPLPMPGHYKAAYLIANVIEQLNPGAQRSPIAKACYYTWNLDGDPRDTGGDPYQSLVSTKRQDPPAGYAPPENCKRPSYAAFEVLRDMRKGEFVRTLLERDASGLIQAATVRQPDNKFRMTVANNSETAKLVSLRFDKLPLKAGTPVYALFQRINAERSTDCEGLEGGDGLTFKVTDAGGQNVLEMPVLDMPSYSVMMVTVWPAQ